MRYLGFDPGLSGGICFLNDDGSVDTCIVMPVITDAKGKNVFDVNAIASFVMLKNNEEKVKLAVVEKPIAMPGLGSPSLVSIGMGHGILVGILAALRIPYITATAQSWQKEILSGVTAGDTKQRSIQFAQQTQPSFDWRATERSKRAHDGMSDSYCIAMYAKRQSK